ncbi:hypothetical protein ACWA3Z_24745, partial [Pseudomonas aeruginosa]
GIYLASALFIAWFMWRDRLRAGRGEAEQEQGEERPRLAPGQRPRCVDQAFSTSIRPHISMCRAWQNQLQ